MDTQKTAASRLSTGIPGCDEVLGGGLFTGRTYLVAGAAGSGKTIFSLHWLLAGVGEGEEVLYLSLAEPTSEIQRNVEAFGWDLRQIRMIDILTQGDESVPAHGEYHVFPPSEVEKTPVWKRIYDAVKDAKPRRLVIDSVTLLRFLATDEYQFRKQLLWLVDFLNKSGCTSYFLFEPSEMERDTSVALAVDGVIQLRSGVSPSLAVGTRSFQVEKLRGSDFLSGYHPLRIGADGIRVFPHRIEEPGSLAPGQRLMSSSDARLDELLGGGLESGTTTLISGPTGTGKSTLGTQFLAHEAQATPAVIFSFEESAAFIATRSRNIGAPIDKLIASGALRVVRINPMEFYPDEFLSIVRRAVEEDGCRMVMIDSLRGYLLAMEEFGKPQAHIHNLVSYLARQGVTTVLISEVENIIGDLVATDMGVSHLADNIILLRYAETAGRVMKVIGCLKKRTGTFQPELRELQITSAGAKVGEKLKVMRGILTGTPEVVHSAE